MSYRNNYTFGFFKNIIIKDEAVRILKDYVLNVLNTNVYFNHILVRSNDVNKIKDAPLESISELKYSLYKVLIKIMPPFQKKKYKRTRYLLC